MTDSLEEAETILFALAQSVEHRDRYTGLHCERLAAYGIALAQALGLPRREQLALYRGGYPPRHARKDRHLAPTPSCSSGDC